MKYTKEILIEASKNAKSVRETVQNLGVRYVSGSMQTHIANQLRKFEIDTSHFLGQGWLKGEMPPNKREASEILVLRSAGSRERGYALLRALREVGRTYECEDCSNDGTWNNRKIRLEVHHKNKNALDNRQENLSILCPNCHASYEN